MKPPITAALMLFLLIQPAVSQELTPAQESLVATERAFAKLSVERGVRASFIEYFADDGIGFNPRPYNVKETLSNRPAPPTPPPTVLNWAPIAGGISQAGDLGWNTGPTLVEDTSPEKRPSRHGMFFSVWKKQPNGNWRVVLDVGISTPAAVAPLTAPFRPANRSSKRSPGGVNQEQETAMLLKAEREFFAAAKSGSVGEAYKRHLSNEARIHRPDMMPIIGEGALRSWHGQQKMSMTGEPIKVEVASSGDLGYAYGRYELGGSKPEKGSYARVWARDPQGRWRVVMDVTNAIPPGQ
jgi:ketosteroid isomerase-like protein